jgi:predicted RNA binding protein YcfA (HicA-like mRNA interferase family)
VVDASTLVHRLARNPSLIISFRDFEMLLKACGFRYQGTTGSHRHYRHISVPWVFTVPDGKDAKRYQVRRLLDIIREYNLSIDP